MAALGFLGAGFLWVLGWWRAETEKSFGFLSPLRSPDVRDGSCPCKHGICRPGHPALPLGTLYPSRGVIATIFLIGLAVCSCADCQLIGSLPVTPPCFLRIWTRQPAPRFLPGGAAPAKVFRQWAERTVRSLTGFVHTVPDTTRVLVPGLVIQAPVAGSWV